tara:strand:+ start:267 stop:512 length:246 start_codon:yes stop_codon:yes gene_type:complete
LIEFDTGDDDEFMRYNSVLNYANKDALLFDSFNLPANLIRALQQEATHHKKRFVMADKLLDWTEIFKDTNYPAIPDMAPIK